MLYHRILNIVSCAVRQNLVVYLSYIYFLKKDLKKIIYWIIFVCAGSSWLRGFFSSCGEQGPLSSCGPWASRCCGFSCCRARALERGASRAARSSSWALEHRFRSCGAWAQRSHGMWDLPAPRIRLVSPALARGFFTTEPPRKPHPVYTCLHLLIPNSESIPPHPLSLGYKWYHMVLVFLFLT